MKRKPSKTLNVVEPRSIDRSVISFLRRRWDEFGETEKEFCDAVMTANFRRRVAVHVGSPAKEIQDQMWRDLGVVITRLKLSTTRNKGGGTYSEQVFPLAEFVRSLAAVIAGASIIDDVRQQELSEEYKKVSQPIAFSAPLSAATPKIEHLISDLKLWAKAAGNVADQYLAESEFMETVSVQPSKKRPGRPTDVHELDAVFLLAVVWRNVTGRSTHRSPAPSTDDIVSPFTMFVQMVVGLVREVAGPYALEHAVRAVNDGYIPALPLAALRAVRRRRRQGENPSEEVN